MNIGPAEILVVLVVALIVFGPKRLPEVGRQVGAAMRELRKMQHSVRSEIDSALNLDGALTGQQSTPSSIKTTPSTIEDVDHPVRPEISMPDDADPPDEPDDGFESPRTFS
jgi:sec-independent protein translocase protein TatA